MRYCHAILATAMFGSGALAADQRTMICSVEQLGIYQDRVHVRCAKPQSLDSANQPIYLAAAAGTPMAAYLVSAIGGYATQSQNLLMKAKISSSVATDVGGGQTIKTDKGDLIGTVASTSFLRVRITYDFDDTSGTAFGCLVADCRIPTSIEIDYR